MALDQLLKTQVQRAIGLLEGINGLGTFTSFGSTTYDPVTDTYTDNSEVIENVVMVKTSLSMREVEASQLTMGSAKFIIAALDLSVKPKKNDTIEFESEIWEIMDIRSPPSNPVWLIYAKKK